VTERTLTQRRKAAESAASEETAAQGKLSGGMNLTETVHFSDFHLGAFAPLRLCVKLLSD
jgi:hypothetical protein